MNSNKNQQPKPLRIDAEEIAKAVIRHQQTDEYDVGIKVSDGSIVHKDMRKEFDRLAVEVKPLIRKFAMYNILVEDVYEINRDDLIDVYAGRIRDEGPATCTAYKGDCLNHHEIEVQIIPE